MLQVITEDSAAAADPVIAASQGGSDVQRYSWMGNACITHGRSCVELQPAVQARSAFLQRRRIQHPYGSANAQRECLELRRSGSMTPTTAATVSGASNTSSVAAATEAKPGNAVVNSARDICGSSGSSSTAVASCI